MQHADESCAQGRQHAVLPMLLHPLSSAPSARALRSVCSFSSSSPCILLLITFPLYSYCWFRSRFARTGVLGMYLDHIRHKVEVQFSSVCTAQQPTPCLQQLISARASSSLWSALVPCGRGVARRSSSPPYSSCRVPSARDGVLMLLLCDRVCSSLFDFVVPLSLCFSPFPLARAAHSLSSAQLAVCASSSPLVASEVHSPTQPAAATRLRSLTQLHSTPPPLSHAYIVTAAAGAGAADPRCSRLPAAAPR